MRGAFSPGRAIALRLRRSILVLLCVMFLVLIVLIATLWISSHNLTLAFISLQQLAARDLNLILIIIVPFLVLASLLSIQIAKAFSIMLYALKARKEQKRYRRLYTVLNEINLVAEPQVNESGEEQNIHRQHKQEEHLLILGSPGAGKTMTLRVRQHDALQHLWKLIAAKDKIPIYIEIKDYNAFLKKRIDKQQITFLEYLMHESALTGIQYLRPYLGQLLKNGRIALLCDGINELDSTHLPLICEELKQFMATTSNQLIITCREVDYRGQTALQSLVGKEYAETRMLQPLKPEDIETFIQKYIDARYVDEQEKDSWKYSVVEIKNFIDRSRLSKHCSNPLILYTLMRTINGMELIQGLRRLDTRGRLYKEFVSQLIKREANKPSWSKNPPDESKVVLFLSELACTARRAGFRAMIPSSSSKRITGGGTVRKIPIDQIADDIEAWLEEPTSSSEVSLERRDEQALISIAGSRQLSETIRYIKFARDADIIFVRNDGSISFRHETIAEYFVAEYLFAVDKVNQSNRMDSIPFIEELLQDYSTWSLPVALWAGLLPDSMDLASRFTNFAQYPRDHSHKYNALALSLVCASVVWAPPQAQERPEINFPANIMNTLREFLPDPKARRQIAKALKQCSEEGSSEVYRALLPLVDVLASSIGELLRSIGDNETIWILFDYLKDMIGKDAYRKHVQGVVQILGSFGNAVVDQALALSQPSNENKKLRIEAINILGRTRERIAVMPLVGYLREPQAIAETAAMALIYLGPAHALDAVIKMLVNVSTDRQVQAQWYALSILKGFLSEHGQLYSVDEETYRRIIMASLVALSSDYSYHFHQVAKEIVLNQDRVLKESEPRRYKTVIALLIDELTTQDEEKSLNIIWLLKQFGKPATPLLLNRLRARPPQGIQVRVIEILMNVRDPEALPALLPLIESPFPKVQDEAARALQAYAPESIPSLIQFVATLATSETAAHRASVILKGIGQAAVEPILATITRSIPPRVHLLIEVLVAVRDPKAIPVLIQLLQNARQDIPFALSLVRALSVFPDKRVAQALYDVLKDADVQLYNESSKALAQLGEPALEVLIPALNVSQDTSSTPGVRDALVQMKPFPAQQLLQAAIQSNDHHARQISLVFKRKEFDTAPFLIDHLCNQDVRVIRFVRQTLDAMHGDALIPPLVDSLHNLAMCPDIGTYLLRFPECIPRIVQQLGDQARGDAAQCVLLMFATHGSNIVQQLVPALDDQNVITQRKAQQTIVSLVHEGLATLSLILQLFRPLSLQNRLRARKALLDVLAVELASVSIPVLLEELATKDAYVRAGASDALVRLALEHEAQNDALLTAGLREALTSADRHDVTEAILIQTKNFAPHVVGDLISDKKLGQSAQAILAKVGSYAFPTIWAAYSNVEQQALRDAAHDTFRRMATADIEADLVRLLTEGEKHETEMALTLLTERIDDEAALAHDKQKMIPMLLAHAQVSQKEGVSQRLMAFLLLQQKNMLIDHMVDRLYKNPGLSTWFIPAFLLLGKDGNEVKNKLERMLRTSLSPKLLGELLSILGTFEEHPEAIRWASAVGSLTSVEECEVALHALGGLLASGTWNAATLRSQYNKSINDGQEGTIEHELYSLLIGVPYAPRLAFAQNLLESERKAHSEEMNKLNKHIRALTNAKIEAEKRADSAEGQINKAEKRADVAEKQAEDHKRKYEKLEQQLKTIQVTQQRH